MSFLLEHFKHSGTSQNCYHGYHDHEGSESSMQCNDSQRELGKKKYDMVFMYSIYNEAHLCLESFLPVKSHLIWLSLNVVYHTYCLRTNTRASLCLGVGKQILSFSRLPNSSSFDLNLLVDSQSDNQSNNSCGGFLQWFAKNFQNVLSFSLPFKMVNFCMEGSIQTFTQHFC